MHMSVLVAISGEHQTISDAYSALDSIMEPYGQEYEVTPYREYWHTPTAVEYYQHNPADCGPDADSGPTMTFAEAQATDDPAVLAEWTRQAVGGYYQGDNDSAQFDPDGTGEYDTYYSMVSYNPNTRWDWWVLGGRWRDFFYRNPGVRVRPPLKMMEAYTSGVRDVDDDGNPYQALRGGDAMGSEDAEDEGFADLIRKRDIDFDRKMEIYALEAELIYDRFEKATIGHEPPAKGQTVQQYRDSDWMKALAEEFPGFTMPMSPLEAFKVHSGGRQAYVESQTRGCHSTYAFVVDGEWLEKDDEGMDDMFARIEQLPDDTWLALVDIHN